jgi:hypothetical protein
MWIKLFWLEIELEPEELHDLLRHLALLISCIFYIAALTGVIFKSIILLAVLRVIGIVLTTLLYHEQVIE